MFNFCTIFLYAHLLFTTRASGSMSHPTAVVKYIRTKSSFFGLSTSPSYCKSRDQPGKVANPAGGHLNRENEYFPVLVRA